MLSVEYVVAQRCLVASLKGFRNDIMASSYVHSIDDSLNLEPSGVAQNLSQALLCMSDVSRVYKSIEMKNIIVYLSTKARSIIAYVEFQQV